MQDITDHDLEFARLTGMLSPGHDESGEAVDLDHYDRHEVRHLLWQLYRDLTDRRFYDVACTMFETLGEIAKAQGAFSRDQLQHAENTIDDMQGLAIDAVHGYLVWADKRGYLGYDYQ